MTTTKQVSEFTDEELYKIKATLLEQAINFNSQMPIINAELTKRETMTNTVSEITEVKSE